MTATEALEAAQACLARAGTDAQRLGHLLARTDAAALILTPGTRSALTHSLNAAADACEELAAIQLDVRWVGIVTLLHNAGAHVWSAQTADTCAQITALMERLRLRVGQLRHMRTDRAVSVRLN